jgi:hypothetical protein
LRHTGKVGHSTTASLFAALLIGGCSFHVDPVAVVGGAADLATVDATVDPPADLGVAPVGDLAAATPDLADARRPTLLGTRDPLDAVTVDLSAEGTLDWAHFGLAAAADVNRKSGGPGALAMTLTGTPQRFDTYAPAFAWHDGAPTATEAGTHAGIYVNNAGDHFTITVPATRTTRLLRLYVAQYKSAATVRAQLSDGSAPDYADDPDVNNAVVGSRYTIQFAAASDDAHLTITWILDDEHGQGSVGLLGAALR